MLTKRKNAGLATGLMMTATLPCAAQPIGFVLDQTLISNDGGGFGGGLRHCDRWGKAMTAIGDLNQDGVTDLAVAAPEHDDGAGALGNHGAVWILFMNLDGSVAQTQKISNTEGGLGPVLLELEEWGMALANIGDIDGDGVNELAVGQPYADCGGAVTTNIGRAWILFLNADGTVREHTTIGRHEGGMGELVVMGDRFGSGLAGPGDLDGDGVPDLVIGADGDDGPFAGGADVGAIWVCFLNNDGTVRDARQIDHDTPGIAGTIDPFDYFGKSVSALGDLNGDGVVDLAVGAPGDSAGGIKRGATHIVFLAADGTVKMAQKIASDLGDFCGHLDDRDYFGWSVEAIGDLDGDDVNDLAIGVAHDDDGGEGMIPPGRGGIPPIQPDTGALWLLLLREDGLVKSHAKISHTQGGLLAEALLFGNLGHGLAHLGDLNGDGFKELAVGWPGYNDADPANGEREGAVWILSIDRRGSACFGDIAGNDGQIDVLDLLDMLGGWGECVVGGPCAGDLDSSGEVDVTDLLMLLAAWGPCPP